MAESPAFDWNQDVNLPVSGNTPAARHASATGAQHACMHVGVKTIGYLLALDLVGEAGLNDQDAAERLHVFRTSINSIRRTCLGLNTKRGGETVVDSALVEPTGTFDLVHFPGRERPTKRARWRLTDEGRRWVAAYRARTCVA